MGKNQVTFDVDVLIQEVKDLVATDKAADDASDALDFALAEQARIALEGEQRKAAVLAEVQAANDAAQVVVLNARVASEVADRMLTDEIAYLQRLVTGETGLVDPTPIVVPPPPVDPLPPVSDSGVAPVSTDPAPPAPPVEPPAADATIVAE